MSKRLLAVVMGNFKTVTLVGTIYDSEVFSSLSTFLLVIVIIFTPWTHNDGTPIYLFVLLRCLFPFTALLLYL
jgi:hypothetical protein